MTHVLRALIPALWILWLMYWIVAARSTFETARREDFASRLSHHGLLIMGGIILGIPHILGAALERRFHGSTPAWRLASAGLVAIGLAFAVAARLWLGRNWSAEVTIKRGHELVRRGPYAMVRHPIYSGVVLALAGTALAIGNARALIGLTFLVAGFIRKLTIEERFMSQQFGDAYAQYRAQVPAIIPFVI
jgi:protein-S-isoprenylcysteine O-methyltransferase Ste14